VEDADLLQAWRDGDKAAGRRLVDRHFDSAYRFFVTKIPMHAEDLVQETFLAVVEGRDRLRDRAAFRPYLFGVARRRLYRFFRDRRGSGVEDRPVEEMVHGLASAREVLAAHQEQKLLLKGLRRLPLRTQILLELSYFEGLTDRELAEIEGIPVGTLKSRLRKARHDLEGAMAAVDGGEILASTTKNFDDWVASIRVNLRQRGVPVADDPLR
jgi:RNA polymerase sigma-70 factor (ECF subfamily)